mgnify:CR=1 FL=1
MSILQLDGSELTLPVEIGRKILLRCSYVIAIDELNDVRIKSQHNDSVSLEKQVSLFTASYVLFSDPLTSTRNYRES